MNRRRGVIRLAIAFSILIFLLVAIPQYIDISDSHRDREAEIRQQVYSELTWINWFLCYIDDSLSPEDRMFYLSVVRTDPKGGWIYPIVAKYNKFSDEEKIAVKKVLSGFSTQYKSFNDATQGRKKFDEVAFWKAIVIGIASVSPIWIIYGLIFFVRMGFKGKRRE
jgi:hypothetical protein